MKKPDCSGGSWSSFQRRMSILDEVSPEARRWVIAQARRRRWARREVLFHEGDPAESLHLLDKGLVAVRVSTPSGDTVTLDVLGRGDPVGELALLSANSPRSATVVALEPTESLEISSGTFEKFRRDNPEATELILAVLAERNRVLNGRLAEALFMSVETRLVRRLLEVDGLHLDSEHGAIPLTQDDLASLAGTSRESANRVLRRLAEEALIELRRGALRVLDREGLRRRAR